MKRFISLIFLLILGLTLVGCNNPSNIDPNDKPDVPNGDIPNDKPDEPNSEAPNDNQEEKPEESKRMISIKDENGNEIICSLNDTSVADSFYRQLPMDVEVGDFSDNEKIFYPKEKLDVSSGSFGSGLLNYYAPWGDVFLLYGDTQLEYNSSVYNVGDIVSGHDLVSSLSGMLHISVLEKSPKTLIVYFSCTNTTENVAKEIHRLIGGDIVEIIPKVEYTSSDLNYNNNSSRANLEQRDDNARPEIANSIDVSNYDVIYLGFPIWWGNMPKIMYTFLESQDFSGKTIKPFCTSGSTGIYSAQNQITILCPNAIVLDGLRVGSLSQLSSWLD